MMAWRCVALVACVAAPALAQAPPPRLTAVIVTPRERVAVFEDAGLSVVAEENEVVSGYTVRSISRGRVEVEQGGRLQVLELAGTAQAPAAVDPMGVTYGVVLNPDLPAPD